MSEKKYLYGAAIIITEGILALHDQTMRALYDLKASLVKYEFTCTNILPRCSSNVTLILCWPVVFVGMFKIGEGASKGSLSSMISSWVQFVV